eukprot:CAMPEP_0184704902 /NCGR_PEP_ID=MMETSP0313-20130426/32658_1 /TAXON_ID=2792 /ORGANISM="Porphyridium aerugineum, Strain SAG 1380-2" /LENGTH=43 /DNA_ID= /DNA_START= /DNA_END= /DNA_ORIENTATION=
MTSGSDSTILLPFLRLVLFILDDDWDSGFGLGFDVDFDFDFLL